MKLFVVLALVALAAANRNPFWDRNQGGGGARFFGDRLMGDTGMDEDIRWSRYGGKLYDSRERYDQINNVDQLRMTNDMNVGRTGAFNDRIDQVRVVDNIDKKLVKHDDDLKMKLLGDDNLLLKQKFFLDVLLSVHKPLVNDDLTRDVHIVDGENNYKNFDKVVDFFRMIRNKEELLPRNRVFSVTNKVHRKQVKNLFNLFVYSKNFLVFQRNVLWARKNINEGMFVHALIAAILHRDDMAGVKVPALYEIMPYKFHTSVTINKALKLKDTVANKNDLIIFNRHTKDYQMMNDEGKLAYLTEDIGWNMYHYFFHMEFASWIGGKDFNLFKERRGEKYLNFIQQILARYNLERLSNGLGDIKDISLYTNLKTGYNPMMIHRNGLPVTMRKNYYDVRSTGDFFLMNRANDFQRRIRDAIDKGFCTSIDGGRVDLKRSDAIDILGNMIQSNIDSVNNRFYGGLMRDMARLLGGAHVKNSDSFKLTTSVMEHTETALRDPVTYQLFKRVMKVVRMYNDYLPTYKKDDLLLDGVRVKNIRTTKLMTYFDFFDVDISTIVNQDNIRTNENRGTDEHTGGTDRRVVARHMRLNHVPFTVNIDLAVDRPQKVVIRTFLGPKFDNNGKIWKLRNNRENFVEIDKFTRDLTNTGEVTIQRHSRDFVYTVRDRTTVMDIYKRVLLNNDVNKLIDLHVDEANCGFPDRLVLPRGWEGGMPLQVFVIVSKAKDIVKNDRNQNLICGKHTLINEADDRTLGFPFDRRIDEGEFYTRNMLFKDVFIYHDDRTNQMVQRMEVDDNQTIDWKRWEVNRMTEGLTTDDMKFVDSRERLDNVDQMDVMRMKMTVV